MSSCAFSLDNRWIVSGSYDNLLKVWDAKSGKCHLTLAGHTGSVSKCSVSLDGSHVVSGSDDNTPKIWDLQTGTCLVTLTGHSDSVTSSVFSRDGRRVLSGSSDNTLKVWNATTGKCLWTGLLLPDQQWAAVDFAGNRILAASPEAWRFLGSRITDSRTGRLRILPAEYYGRLPAGRDLPR